MANEFLLIEKHRHLTEIGWDFHESYGGGVSVYPPVCIQPATGMHRGAAITMLAGLWSSLLWAEGYQRGWDAAIKAYDVED